MTETTEPTRQSSRPRLSFLPAAILIILAGAATYAVSGNPFSRATLIDPVGKRLDLARAHWRGSENTTLGLIVFSDFECPYCAELATTTLPTIVEKFVDTGVLRLGFAHFPLTTIHPMALEIAAFSECMSEQGDFWNVHDRLFANLTQLDSSRRKRVFPESSWDLPKADKCASGWMTNRIMQDISEAKRLGVTSTPALMLGRKWADNFEIREVITGAPTVAELEAAIGRLRR